MIVAIRMLGVPVPMLILVLDLRGLTGRALFLYNPPGGCQGVFPPWKTLGKDIAEPVGPAAIMWHDPVMQFRHD